MSEPTKELVARDMGETIKLFPVGCALPSSDTLTRYAYDAHSDIHHQHVQHIATTASYGFYGARGDPMVSQANFFRDDNTGELFPTPAAAIESERESRKRLDGLPPLEW